VVAFILVKCGSRAEKAESELDVVEGDTDVVVDTVVMMENKI